MHNGFPGRGLLVDRIEVNDFRLYKNLRVERFGRVNLIVGKNGAGKTSLLEALRILATVGAPHVLWEIVSSRDEQGQSFQLAHDRPLQPQGIMNLFRRGADVDRFSISSSSRSLSAEFAWYRAFESDGQGLRLDKIMSASEADPAELRPMIDVHTETMSRRVSLDQRFLRPGPALGGEWDYMYVGSSGVSGIEAARLWDRVALTQSEEQVISSLAMIYPGLTRISMAANADDRTRAPWVKLSSLDQPVPLKTLGDGVSRIFGIAVLRENSRNRQLAETWAFCPFWIGGFRNSDPSGRSEAST